MHAVRTVQRVSLIMLIKEVAVRKAEERFVRRMFVESGKVMSNSIIDEAETLCQITNCSVRSEEFYRGARNLMPKLLAQNKKLLEFIRNEAISRYRDRFGDMLDDDELREASEAYGDTYIKVVMTNL